ncbi:MAG: 23S rRNA (guanosine(2251)-2'-O)-methyltransferase RlmB [Bdellovibrionales bacterium GWB1_55_8]|nr:MAG: 23S rRNA (guanosine(2251)-2'-O)-methyltransferase RlmB [Bdellovibrionales bacterium GWB1_55_8]
MNLTIRNPHSVLAALERRAQDVIQISLPRGGAQRAGEAWEEVVRVARSKGITVSEGGAKKAGPAGPPSKHGVDAGREGAAEALVRERQGVPVEELFAQGRERKNGRGLWLALDSLQDPHNVGAIFRTAAFFGVEGILLTQERSAPLSSTVYDVASGGVEYVPFTLQTNLQRGFEVAKEAGLWLLGTSEHANDDISSVAHDRPWLLVLGNEEKGMRRLTEEACDVLCRVSPQGKVTSLNVSVAAGVLISALSRP